MWQLWHLSNSIPPVDDLDRVDLCGAMGMSRVLWLLIGTALGVAAMVIWATVPSGGVR